MAEPILSQLPQDHHDLSEQEYRNWLIFYQRKRSELSNERKFIAWVRTSVALATLGFIVERVELFLMRRGGVSLDEGLSIVTVWIPRLFFALGGIVAIIGTWEFFHERHRITVGDMSRSPLLDFLIIAILIVVLIISILFLLPGP
jgi:putative membrane protein